MRFFPWILLGLLALFVVIFVRKVDEHRYGRAGHKFERGPYSGQVEFSPTAISGVIYHYSDTPITTKDIQISVTDEYKYNIEGELKIQHTTLMPDDPERSYTSFAFSPTNKGPYGTWRHTGLYNFSIKLFSDDEPVIFASSYWEKFSSYRVVSPIYLGWK